MLTDRRCPVLCSRAAENQKQRSSFGNKCITEKSLRATVLTPLFITAGMGLPPPSLAAELPAAMSKGSYYVTLGLFVMTAPGLWSLIKRSTKSKIRRRTYSVPGPAETNSMPLDDRAKEIVRYFLSYNYQVKSMSDVISFVGNFQSSLGQALQLVLYSFFGQDIFSNRSHSRVPCRHRSGEYSPRPDHSISRSGELLVSPDSHQPFGWTVLLDTGRSRRRGPSTESRFKT